MNTPAHFTTPLQVQQVTGETWALLAPVQFVRANGDVITVPAGFHTDFASVPSFAWSLGFPKSGIYDAAAVVHDFLYRTHAVGPRWIERAEADDILLEAMDALGTGYFTARIMYYAVRACGGSYWGDGDSAQRAAVLLLAVLLCAGCATPYDAYGMGF